MVIGKGLSQAGWSPPSSCPPGFCTVSAGGLRQRTRESFLGETPPPATTATATGTAIQLAGKPMTDYGSSTPLSVDSKPHELHRIEEHQHDCDLCAHRSTPTGRRYGTQMLRRQRGDRSHSSIRGRWRQSDGGTGRTVIPVSRCCASIRSGRS